MPDDLVSDNAIAIFICLQPSAVCDLSNKRFFLERDENRVLYFDILFLSSTAVDLTLPPASITIRLATGYELSSWRRWCLSHSGGVGL